MLETRVMPCLLLHGNRLVKTVNFKNRNYIGDPINAIKIYNEKEVDELIVVDIDATLENREPNYEVIAELASECFMPLCYGGGIRNIEQIRRIFNLGVEKVAVNSYAAENPEFIREASSLFGGQSIVASVDIKKNFWGKYVVKTHSANKRIAYNPVEYVQLMESMGAGEILLNSVDRDGTWKGFDLELVKEISESVTIPLIALGGAGSLKDIGEAVSIGRASAVAIGSMAVYQGEGLGVLIGFPQRKDLLHLFANN